MKKYTRFRGFTLIELLIVMAIIGLLAAIVLISLSTARDRAKNAAYITYMTQSKKLVAGAIAAGYLDDITVQDDTCLGIYTGSSFCIADPVFNTALTRLSDVPDPGVISPFNDTAGVFLSVSPVDSSYIRINAGVSIQSTVTQGICNEAGWSTDSTGAYCYIDLNRFAS